MMLILRPTPLPSDAHHTKTTSFAELLDQAEDAQIPNDITLDLSSIQAAASSDFHNIGGTDLVDDADADPNNEFQTLFDVLSEGNDAGGMDVLNLGSLSIGSATTPAEIQIEGNIKIAGEISSGQIPEFSKLDASSISKYNWLRSDDGIGTWQSFTMESSGMLVDIDLCLSDSQGIENGTLQIYSGQGTGGVMLMEQSISGSGCWSSFALNNPVPVEEGAQYTFRVVDIGSDFYIQYDSPNPYPGGVCSYDVSYDLCFKTHVAVPSVYILEDGSTISIANGAIEINASTNDVIIDRIFAGMVLGQVSEPSRPDASSISYDSWGTMGDEIWQSFTAESNGLLTQIDLQLIPVFSFTGNLQVYSGEGTSGTILTEQSISTDIDGWQSFILNNRVPVISGAKYTFNLQKDSGALNISADWGNPYPGGEAWLTRIMISIS